MIHNSVLWQVARQAPDDFVQKFPEYSRLISQLLFNRALDTQNKIDEFFDADYSAHMHDPYLFRDMEKAVERILRAIEKKEKIVIYGDYDADGISGSVILYSALTLLGAKSDVYIPDRFSEGYGLNKKALDEILKDKKTGLIIAAFRLSRLALSLSLTPKVTASNIRFSFFARPAWRLSWPERF